MLVLDVATMVWIAQISFRRAYCPGSELTGSPSWMSCEPEATLPLLIPPVAEHCRGASAGLSPETQDFSLWPGWGFLRTALQSEGPPTQSFLSSIFSIAIRWELWSQIFSFLLPCPSPSPTRKVEPPKSCMPNPVFVSQNICSVTIGNVLPYQKYSSIWQGCHSSPLRAVLPPAHISRHWCPSPEQNISVFVSWRNL